MNASEFNIIINNVKDDDSVKSNINSVVKSCNSTYLSLYIHHMYIIGIRKYKLDVLIDPIIKIGSSSAMVYILPYIHPYQRNRVLGEILKNNAMSYVVDALCSCHIEDIDMAVDYVYKLADCGQKGRVYHSLSNMHKDRDFDFLLRKKSYIDKNGNAININQRSGMS